MMKEIIKKILAGFIGVLAALLVLEAGLRLAGFIHQEIRTQQGRASAHKQGNPYVVLCLGNSYTEGYGAPSGMSYPAQLQRLVDARIRSVGVTVINEGQGNQNTAELLSHLKANIERYHPNLIVLQTGQPNEWNYLKYGDYLARQKLNGGSSNGRRYFFNGLLSRSRVYRLMLLFRHSRPWHRYNFIKSLEYKQDEKYTAAVDLIKHMNYSGRSLPVDASQTKEAFLLFQNGVNVDPGEPQNYFGLGALYHAEGNDDEALKWYFKALNAALACDSRYWEIESYKHIRWIRNAPVTPDFIASEFNGALTVDLLAAALRKRGVGIPEGNGIDYINQNILTDKALYKNYDDVLLTAEDLNLIGQMDAAGRNKLKRFNRSLMERGDSRQCPRHRVYEVLRQSTINRKIDEFLALSQRRHPDQVIDFVGLKSSEVLSWVESDLKEIVRVIQEKKIGLIIANYPKPLDANSILFRVAGRFNLPFIDNDSIFQDKIRQGVRDQDLFVYDGHCNARGYGLMAENVLDKITAEGFLK